jgi:hemerythrin-like metal-binding protein
MNSEIKLAWSPALSVGNAPLDNEHRILLARMNELVEANGRSMDKAWMLGQFDELVALTRHHFDGEEEHMALIGYPGLKQHQRIHDQLFTAMEKYRSEFQQSVYGRFPSSVFDFFATWLTTHIMIVDRQYADYERRCRRLVEAHRHVEGHHTAKTG